MNTGSEKQRDRDEKVVETSSSESKHHFGIRNYFIVNAYFFLIKFFTPLQSRYTYQSGIHCG